MIINTYIPNPQVEFLLLGKFQTDALEGRFSKYRRLSGTNYFISVQQIFESEKKIRLRNIIENFKETVVFKNTCKTFRSMLECDIQTYIHVLNSNYLTDSKYDKEVSLYVCGYAANSVIRRMSPYCNNCEQLLVDADNCPNDNDDGYFSSLQNGGLKYPTVNLEIILFHMQSIISNICSNEIKTKFLVDYDQKSILVNMTYNSIIKENAQIVFLNLNCACGRDSMDIYIQVMSCFANILLKNLAQNINDECHKKVAELAIKKRALKPLNQNERKIQVFKNSNLS